MRFITTQYKFSYRQAPRGRGFWWFEANGETFSGEGLFSEVKKEATKWARGLGATEVTVLP